MKGLILQSIEVMQLQSPPGMWLELLKNVKTDILIFFKLFFFFLKIFYFLKPFYFVIVTLCVLDSNVGVIFY